MEMNKRATRNKDFWSACQAGDLATVQKLLLPLSADNLSLNPNWSNPDYRHATALFVACQRGDAALVRVLLRDPRIDPNQPDMTRYAPLYIACMHGYEAVVEAFLQNPRTDPNTSDCRNHTPLYIACANGFMKVVELLLLDYRIDANRTLPDCRTPLHLVCRTGNLMAAKMLLAAETRMDTQKRGIYEEEELTALDIAKKKKHLQIIELLARYEQDPAQTRRQLRQEFGWIGSSGQVFAPMVFVCDGLLQLKGKEGEEEEERTRRFFEMATQLPLELQMVLANRCHGLATNLIPHRDREQAFRYLARVYCAI